MRATDGFYDSRLLVATPRTPPHMDAFQAQSVRTRRLVSEIFIYAWHQGDDMRIVTRQRQARLRALRDIAVDSERDLDGAWARLQEHHGRWADDAWDMLGADATLQERMYMQSLTRFRKGA